MVWIDEVLNYSEKEGECRVILKSGEHYFAPHGLRPSSCLEFIAQAYGFISACYHVNVLDPSAKPLSKAFFASMKDAQLPTLEAASKLKSGDVLNIKISAVRQIKQIVSFTGQVFHGSVKLAEAQVRIFREHQS